MNKIAAKLSIKEKLGYGVLSSIENAIKEAVARQAANIFLAWEAKEEKHKQLSVYELSRTDREMTLDVDRLKGIERAEPTWATWMLRAYGQGAPAQGSSSLLTKKKSIIKNEARVSFRGG